MKKIYSKPMIEIDAFELTTSLAASCSNQVDFGPGIPGSSDKRYQQCDDFKGSGFLSIIPGVSVNSAGNTPFYADGSANCDCYYTSGGMGYFMS